MNHQLTAQLVPPLILLKVKNCKPPEFQKDYYNYSPLTIHTNNLNCLLV